MITEKTKSKKLKIGYNFFWEDRDKPAFHAPAEREKSADFIFCHFGVHGTFEQTLKSAEELAARTSELGLELIVNTEQANGLPEIKNTDGREWTNAQEGTHRFEFPKELVEALASHGNLVGLAYDEFEHCIINRNVSLRLESKGKLDIPVFPVAQSGDFFEQGNLLDAQIGEYAERNKNGHNIALAGEHVFPVLFHTFARNGITPNFKSQKESFSDIQFAIAAGAALQYKTELWNCVDLWYRLTCPGHSSEEMYNNLVFAYLAGVDRVYVEHSGKFFENESTELTEYGKAFYKFLDEYSDADRDYNISDYRPVTGIIKYDDTYWGQCDPIAWRPILFGNPKIKTGRKAREFTKVFHVLTHGESGKNGLSWSRISPWSLRKHRSFASMNSVAVFDDRVDIDTLSSLKLCFLCGYGISNGTLAAVEKLVRENGLTVVTPKRFLPGRLTAKGHYCEIPDGNGKWIVTSNPTSAKVKKAVQPFIGKKGEIKLRFTSNVLTLKISEDGNSFTFTKDK